MSLKIDTAIFPLNTIFLGHPVYPQENPLAPPLAPRLGPAQLQPRPAPSTGTRRYTHNTNIALRWYEPKKRMNNDWINTLHQLKMYVPNSGFSPPVIFRLCCWNVAILKLPANLSGTCLISPLTGLHHYPSCHNQYVDFIIIDNSN